MTSFLTFCTSWENIHQTPMDNIVIRKVPSFESLSTSEEGGKKVKKLREKFTFSRGFITASTLSL